MLRVKVYAFDNGEWKERYIRYFKDRETLREFKKETGLKIKILEVI